MSLLEECLEDTGPDRVGACDASPNLGVACTEIIDSLPAFADTPQTCIAEMTLCLDFCTEYSYGWSDDEEFFTSATCWAGHQGSSSSAEGNCSQYAWEIDSCGGSFAGDTTQACELLCESTEGAWDEGPFDGCYDDC